MYRLSNSSASPPTVATSSPEAKRDVRLRLYVKLMVLDCLSISIAFLLISALRGKYWLSFEQINLAAMVMPIYIGVAINGNAYSLQALKNPFSASAKSVLNLLFAMLAILCVLYFTHYSGLISRISLSLALILSAVFIFSIRRPFSRYALRRTGGAFTDDVIITDSVVMDAGIDGHVVDAVSHGLTPDLNDPQMLNRIGKWLRTFDRVVVACPPERRHAWLIVLQGAGVQGEIMLNDAKESGAIGIGRCMGRDTHIVSKGPLSMSMRLQKRALDLALAVPAIVFFSPLLLLVALAIKLESRGPVLFFQERVGLGNRIFRIAKFRSMREEHMDSSGSVSATRTDDRITRVGQVIRRTSIDELPQLFNVLLGDMSIVGPRPHALGSTVDTRLFWEVNHQYWCRHALKPGMTGLAQVRGFRGATDRIEDLENRLSADLEYLKDWSLAGEILIILQTFRVMVHRNAY
ncbi:MAG: sugar transferase [bacterium]|nr:sugar transferase [bacterium]